MKYRGGYKYQLAEDIIIPIGWGVNGDINTQFIDLIDGALIIRSGYAWDGPSGPTIDTKTFMRGSLAHDALYQLIRQGYLSDNYRKSADDALRDICLKDSMNRLRAWWVYKAVRIFGSKATDKPKKIFTAP